MSTKKALIIGVTGLDGSHLADLLLEKGYEVHGVRRRSSSEESQIGRIKHILDKITLHHGELTDATSLYDILEKVKPDEIYNEADQDHAGLSFQMPELATKVTAGAVSTLLELIKGSDMKLFQPISSNIFGIAHQTPQNEETKLNPQSPYACAKAYAYLLCRFHRKAYNTKVYTAILYNHTSPRQLDEYIVPKLVKEAKRVCFEMGRYGVASPIKLGDINAKIDIGSASEYMEAAWRIMQTETPDDYIVGTGEVHSIKEILGEIFNQLGANFTDAVVSVDETLLRPSNPMQLVANCSKLWNNLGWEPKVKLKELIKLMLNEQ